METKICSKCKEEKDVCDFGLQSSNKDNLKSSCKECRKIEGKIYRKLNPEKRKETIKNWYNKNPNYNKEYYSSNFVEINKKNKEWYYLNIEKHKENSKKWDELNKEKIKEYRNNRIKIIRKTDPIGNLKLNIRTRTYNILKTKNIKKQNKTFDIIGCTSEFLKEYLEKQFKDGMTWDNYGKNGWHVDHIIPLSSGKNEEEVYKLCNYTNLQPLWAEENLSKGNKIL